MAPPDVETSDDRDEEWPAGYPVIGFKNLFRLAIASCVLAIPNFACQVYLADAIQYAGTKREDIKAVNSVWAYAVGLACSAHMVWVARRGVRQIPGTKGHLVIAIITTFFGCLMLLTGLALSVVSAGQTQPLSRAVVGECYYFNATFMPTNHPLDYFLCDACDIAKRRVCCCCVEDYFSIGSLGNVNLYGVSSCDGVKDAVFPITTLSAVFYGLSLFPLMICFVVTSIMTCQCYCCSINCGPFPKPAPREKSSRRPFIIGQSCAPVPVNPSQGAHGAQPAYVVAAPAPQNTRQEPVGGRAASRWTHKSAVYNPDTDNRDSDTAL